MAGRVVPWSSWAEWLDVKKQLMSHNSADWSGGIDRVAAWRARGKVSLGVDITACLREAQQQDTLASAQASHAAGSSPGPWEACHSHAATGNNTLHSTQPASHVKQQVSTHPVITEQMLRTGYSLPLVRMVNGISDSQQRGKVASSVASLSSQAGLPKVLVDIRHSSTHGELPSLPLLRLGARTALDWLRNCYWDSQEQQLRDSQCQVAALIDTLSMSCKAAAAKCKSTQGNMVAGGSSDDEEESEGAVEGYTSAAGQLQRKQTMSELRSLIPSPWTQLLVPPLIQMGAMDPPGVSPGGIPDPWQETGTSAPAGDVVAELAWANGMGHLIRHYSTLRLQLLHASVLAMTHPCTISAATRYSLWVSRLLPCVIPKRGSNIASSSATSTAHPSANQQGSKQSRKRKLRAAASLEQSNQDKVLLPAQHAGAQLHRVASFGSGFGFGSSAAQSAAAAPPGLSLSGGHEQTLSLAQLQQLHDRALANHTSAKAADTSSAVLEQHIARVLNPWSVVTSLLSSAVTAASHSPKPPSATIVLDIKTSSETAQAAAPGLTASHQVDGDTHPFPLKTREPHSSSGAAAQNYTHQVPPTTTIQPSPALQVSSVAATIIVTSSTPPTITAVPVSALAAARALQAQLLQHLPLRTTPSTLTSPTAEIMSSAQTTTDLQETQRPKPTSSAPTQNPTAATPLSTVVEPNAALGPTFPSSSPAASLFPVHNSQQHNATGPEKDTLPSADGLCEQATHVIQSNSLLHTQGTKWILATGWSACAIGCLPGPMSVSGVLPTLCNF